jgi:hypothetical protein
MRFLSPTADSASATNIGCVNHENVNMITLARSPGTFAVFVASPI